MQSLLLSAYVEVQARPNNPSYIERKKGGLFLKDFQSNVDLIDGTG